MIASLVFNESMSNFVLKGCPAMLSKEVHVLNDLFEYPQCSIPHLCKGILLVYYIHPATPIIEPPTFHLPKLFPRLYQCMNALSPFLMTGLRRGVEWCTYPFLNGSSKMLGCRESKESNEAEMLYIYYMNQ